MWWIFVMILEKSELITRIDSEDIAYQPSFDIHKMDLYEILTRYEQQGMSDFDPRKSKAFENIEDKLEEIEEQWKAGKANILLKDL